MDKSRTDANQARRMMDTETSLLVRDPTGEINSVEVSPGTTAGDLLTKLEFNAHQYQVVHLSRDAFDRVVETTIVQPFECIIDYLKSKKSEDDMSDDEGGLECTTSQDEEKKKPIVNKFRLCDVWIVHADHRVRIFFNAYTRMVLGLPRWYLDVWMEPGSRCIELEVLVAACLASEEDERFTLYGNYRTHCSRVSPSAIVAEIVKQEDVENEKFWQFMMMPEQENQSQLGVSRISPLLKQTSLIRGSKKYWTVLQGTSMLFYQSPSDRKVLAKIDRVDRCQVVYRGGSREKGNWMFDIIEPGGRMHRCKSQSRRRVEKWIRCLQRCHPTREINEPIDMNIIKKYLEPQPHPDPIPERIKPLPHEEITLKPSIESFLDQTETSDTSASLLHRVEMALRKLELTAETLSTPKKRLRRKEAMIWSEQLRVFMLLILRPDHPHYGLTVLPELVTLTKEISNFLDLALGNGEFEGDYDITMSLVEPIMDSANCLFLLFRQALEEVGSGGSHICDPALHGTKQYRDNKILMMKMRQAIKKPFHRIRLERLLKDQKDPVGVNDSTLIKVVVKSPMAKDKSGVFSLGWFSNLNSKRKVQIPREEAQALSVPEKDSAWQTELETAVSASEGETVVETKKGIGKKKSFWRRLVGRIREKSSSHETKVVEVETVDEEEEQHETNGTADDELAEPLRVRSPGVSKQVRTVINEVGTVCSVKCFENDRTNRDEITALRQVATTPLQNCHRPSDSEEFSSGSSSGFQSEASLNGVRPRHRRSQSLRPVNSEDEKLSTPTAVGRVHGHGQRSRRRSVVEIDPTLLGVLLKDPRLARLISPRAGDNKEGLIVPSGLPSNIPESCTACKELIMDADQMIRTPFAVFHISCLKCKDCGVQLTTTSFNLEQGKPKCKSVCTMTTDEATIAKTASCASPNKEQRPLKSILKKSSTCT